jgi:hypothetical protein
MRSTGIGTFTAGATPALGRCRFGCRKRLGGLLRLLVGLLLATFGALGRLLTALLLSLFLGRIGLWFIGTTEWPHRIAVGGQLASATAIHSASGNPAP